MPHDTHTSARPGFFGGAAILASAAVLAKIIGAVFKIPLANLLKSSSLGDGTYSLFTVTYLVYSLLLTISYSGIPVAMSRLVSAAAERGDIATARRLFTVALPAFAVVGAAVSAAMFFFAPQLAALMQTPKAAAGIRVLSPAVFLCCVVSVYEGYSQGFSDMLPTAVKQIVEVAAKLVFGLAAAWLLLRRGASGEVVAAGAISGAVIGLALALPVLMAMKRRRTDRALVLKGGDISAGDALRTIFRVSVPITLGACCMSIITLADTIVVKRALLRYNPQDVTDALHGVYAQAQTLFTMIPALLAPVTVAVLPAISAAVAVRDEKGAKSVTESASKLICLIAAPAAVGLAVLGSPVYAALFGSSRLLDGGRLVAVFGPAAFFACTQQITTAVLQANGHEKVPMITFPIGGAAQITLDYLLVSRQNIGILGSPFGTLTCYAVISLLNFAFLAAKVKTRPRLMRVLVKPVILAVIMGAAVWGVNGLLARVLGSSRLDTVLALGVAVVAGVAVYFALVVLTRTITREDLTFVPRGEKIAKFLRL
ncbi:MAG: polysaccharide biosynthesis protein [Oscillospiraceae bacterium]|jgi:stage V sporulation protein B|nr:polysaccharide biosynthesis protein [Oscillospiraceae bacterium]